MNTGRIPIVEKQPMKSRYEGGRYPVTHEPGDAMEQRM